MDASIAEKNTRRREATLWFRKNEKGVYEYNHLEDGHATGDTPMKKHPAQSGWARASWIQGARLA